MLHSGEPTRDPEDAGEFRSDAGRAVGRGRSGKTRQGGGTESRRAGGKQHIRKSYRNYIGKGRPGRSSYAPDRWRPRAGDCEVSGNEKSIVRVERIGKSPVPRGARGRARRFIETATANKAASARLPAMAPKARPLTT